MKVKFLLFLLFSIACFSQQKGDVKLDWIEKTEISFNTYALVFPKFKSENFTFNSANKAIFYTINLPQSTQVDENSLQITNIIFEPISLSQLGDLNIKAIPNSINATIKPKEITPPWAALRPPYQTNNPIATEDAISAIGKNMELRNI